VDETAGRGPDAGDERGCRRHPNGRGQAIISDETLAQRPCLSCGVLTSVNKRGGACRHCGGYRLQTTGGTVLRVVEMLVKDE
jgi:Zn finger protein HypA/HybF involved in hydrogenase expression